MRWVVVPFLWCAAALAQQQPTPWSYMYEQTSGAQTDDRDDIPQGVVRRVDSLTTSELGRFGEGSWTVYWTRMDGNPPGCTLESGSGGVEVNYTAGQPYFVFSLEGTDGAEGRARAEGVQVVFDRHPPFMFRPARDPDHSSVYVTMEHFQAWKNAMSHARTMTVSRIDSHVPSAPWQVDMDGVVPAMAVMEQFMDRLQNQANSSAR